MDETATQDPLGERGTGPDDEIESAVTRAWGGTLRGDEEPGETIKRRVAPTSAGTVPPEDLPTADLRPAGRGPGGAARPPGPAGPAFELVRVVGRGGMGVVHAARQLSLAREVALKMPVAPEEVREVAEGRFIAEALVTGDLDHPNIVPVHDLGRDAAGRLYMAMKLVRGTPWDRLLHPERGVGTGAGAASGAVAPAARGLRDHLEVLLKVCDAVAFAHARGIVHRDLKPENVMVGAFGEVLVMDWGIALDVKEEAGAPHRAEARSTASGAAGTPSYMPPELALGRIDLVGPTTDVYLLGAILYEILTGGPPHRGRTVTEVLRAAARDEVEPPRAGAPGGAVPAELSRVCLRALARRPRDRFPDVPSLQRAVREYLSHADSLRLTEGALRDLGRLAAPGEVTRETRYGLHAGVQSALLQALSLWPENEEALEGQARAAEAWAEEALGRGDLGLAAAQLAVMEANPRADAGRRAGLAAAVEAHGASRRRAGLAALGLACLLGCAWFAYDGWGRRHAEETEARAHEARVSKAIWGAWVAGRDGLAQRAREERLYVLREAPQEGQGGTGRAEALTWAELVPLWREGAWGRLLEALVAILGETPLSGVEARALAERAEVSGGVLAGVLGDDLVPAGPAVPVALPAWATLADAARMGASPEALEAGVEAAEAVESARRAEGWAARAGLRRLRRGALFGVAARAARARGEGTAAAAFEGRVPRYRLRSSPLGGPGPGGGVRCADVVEVTDGGRWRGVDRETGEVLWDRLPLSQRWDAQSSVGAADGTVTVLARHRVLSLSGADGALLGRVELEGEAFLAWPDPLDLDTLVVAMGIEERLPMGLSGGGAQVELYRLRGGHVVPRPFPTGLTSLGPVMQGWQKLLEAEGAGAGDVGAARVREALGEAARRDHANPHAWLAALEAEGSGAPEGLRLGLASGAARAAEGVSPFEAVGVGVSLERRGYRALADQVYGGAASRFLALSGNADLAVIYYGNPVPILRTLGAELFEAGEVERALELVEVGRRFSSFTEMDHGFYRRYLQWARSHGRPEDVRRIAPRVEASRLGGGAFLMPAMSVVWIDMLLFIALIAPPVFLVLVGRLWWRSRADRVADLHDRGMRGVQDRLTAFATRPLDRMAGTSLSYASRPERLAIVVAGMVVISSWVGVAASVEEIAHVATTPLYLGNGYAGSAGTMRYLELRARQGEAPRGTLRLLAEGHRARGEVAAAGEVLGRARAQDPADPLVLNNLAVLEEEAGRAAAARDLYARAAGRGGEGAAVARWNLARLSGQALLPAEGLAHRDALRLEAQGAGAPLWAACPLEDLMATLRDTGGIAERWLAGMGELLSPGSVATLLGSVSAEGGGGPMPILVELAFHGVLWVTALALVAVPFPVRRPRDREGGRASRVRLLAAVVGSAWPGLWDLLLGRPVAGALQAMAFVGIYAVERTVREGGLLSSISMVSFGKVYFPDVVETAAVPELAGLGEVAAWVFRIGLTANVPLTLARAWRRGLGANPGLRP